ncbi:MAG: transposase, partial [Methyloprofundus sp.]|nr:transposase [Methyloprofundus sp.]
KFRSERKNELGHHKINFVGYRRQCKACELKQRCMKTPASADHYNGCGRQVSFILEKTKRKPNFTDWMKRRVDSPKGKLIYSHRMSVIEPVFGNIGTNKKLNRFSLRGKKKVQGQWQLYCMVHNIEKIKNYGKLAA